MIVKPGYIHNYEINFLKAPKVAKPKRFGLAKVSDSRKEANKLYEAAKRQWREDLKGAGQWKCQFRGTDGTGCSRRPSDSPHHSRFRGKYLCDKSTFRALCNHHHNWVHFVDPAKAEELGLLFREYEKH